MTTPSPDAVSTPLTAPPDQLISVVSQMPDDVSIPGWLVEIHTDKRRIQSWDFSLARALLIAGLCIRSHRAEALLTYISNEMASDDYWSGDTTDAVFTILRRAGYMSSCPECGFATAPTTNHVCH